MRLATLDAAMRRGCVWPISPCPPAPLPRPSGQRDLGQLGGLARAGLAADDDDLVGLDGPRDLVAPAGDRKRIGKVIGGIGLAITGLRVPAYRGGEKLTSALRAKIVRLFQSVHRKPSGHESCLPSHFVPWFRSVAPYIHAHRGKTFVVAIAGELVAAGKLPTFAQDLAILHAMGIKLVLVHGFRPQVEEQLALKGHVSRFSHGMRVTDPVALDCAQEAAGQMRYEIEAAFSQGLPNTPMAHSQIRVISGNFITARPVGILDGVDFQHTGLVRKIDAAGIRRAVEFGATRDGVARSASRPPARPSTSAWKTWRPARPSPCRPRNSSTSPRSRNPARPGRPRQRDRHGTRARRRPQTARESPESHSTHRHRVLSAACGEGERTRRASGFTSCRIRSMVPC